MDNNSKMNQLYKVADFCAANRINYVLTGTLALYILGIPSTSLPKDIDILVLDPTESQLQTLSELQFLSGLDTEHDKYSRYCYSFLVEGVRVSAIVVDTEDGDELPISIVTYLKNEETGKTHFVPVHLVHSALKAKMKLGRDKDKTYMLNLINYLTDL